MNRLLSGVTVSSIAAAIFGVAIIVRCEVGPQPPGGWIGCWLVGGIVSGVPGLARVAEQVGYLRGYNTLNPALRRPQEEDRP